MEHTSAICAQRLIGPLAFLDLIYQHVHRTLKSRHIKDWCAQSCSVWDPSSILLQEELEKVQKRAARFVTGNYIYETGSMTGRTTKVGISEKRRRDSRIIMLYKGLKGAASIPTNDLVPPIRHVRNHHSLAFQTPLLILTFTSAISSPRLLEIGIHSQILSFLLLKEQKTLLLSSLLW